MRWGSAAPRRLRVAAVIVPAIEAYRRWISPRKGFRCAYGTILDTASCSTFGLLAARRFPGAIGVRLIRHRLLRCRQAAMGRIVHQGHVRVRRQSRRREELVEWCDAPCLVLDLPGCTPAHHDLSCGGFEIALDCDVCSLASCW